MGYSHRAELDHITAYVPGKSVAEVRQALGLSDVIKMASNENPLGCPVPFEALRDAYSTIHHYPHQLSTGLIQAIAQKHRLPLQSVLLGNGSDELLQFLGLTFLTHSDEVIFSQCTFSEYRFVGTVMGARIKAIPLDETYRLDLPAYLAAITSRTKLMFICNPNNPTGTYVTHDELNAFLAQVPAHVVVCLDEAYADFSDAQDFPRSVELMHLFSNVVVLRTFSKLYGLAGFRIGYALAQPRLIEVMGKVRMPFHVNTLALVVATQALQADDFVLKSLHVNAEGKKFLTKSLQKKGLFVLPSQANFVTFFLKENATSVVADLLKQGVIVRHLDSFGLPNAIRVTVGLPEHNQIFLQRLETLL